MYSLTGFDCVPSIVVSVRTPENSSIGLYFFLSPFVGLTAPSTNASFSLAPSASASVPAPSAATTPTDTKNRDFLITAPPLRLCGPLPAQNWLEPR